MKLRDAEARDPPCATAGRPKRYTNGVYELRGPILAIPELSRFDIGSKLEGTTAGLGVSPNSSGRARACPVAKGAGKFGAYTTKNKERF